MNEQLKKDLSSVLFNSFRTNRNFHDYEHDEHFFKLLSTTLEKLEANLTNVKNNDSLDYNFSLNSDLLGASKTSDVDIPLYFWCDLIIGILKKDYYEYAKNKTNVEDLISKLSQIRDKSSKFKFDNKYFDPSKKLSDVFLDEIIHSKGDFAFKKEKSDNFDYISIDSTQTYEHGSWKNGEYYHDETSIHHSSEIAVFEEDKDYLNNLKFEKEREKLNEIELSINSVVGKYFKSGKLPDAKSFHEELVNDVDYKIKFYLSELCQLKKQDFETTKNFGVNYYLDQIRIIEKTNAKELEKIEKEKKSSSIEAARNRYKSQGFLWKFFNKKMNPNNLDFGSMQVEEIESLYRRR